jgi:hypothetical protein
MTMLSKTCLLTSWPMKMRPIASPETSVSNHLTPLNNPEDGRTEVNLGGSLWSRKTVCCNVIIFKLFRLLVSLILSLSFSSLCWFYGRCRTLDSFRINSQASLSLDICDYFCQMKQITLLPTIYILGIVTIISLSLQCIWGLQPYNM